MHLYLHIPFCRQACYYCDFHFSTSLNNRSDMTMAICQEIKLQRSFLPQNKLETIYFGGGTPSLLEEEELRRIFDTIHTYFQVLPNAEITLEANPDDLTPAKLRMLRQLGVNRLSIGIQSFNANHLNYLHRIHTAEEAQVSVKAAQDAGFENLTIDLIYAIPASTHDIWQQDLEQALTLGVPHISAYCLTIEPQTVFGKWLKNRKIVPIDDAFAAEQFRMLIDQLGKKGYEQYEISNFALPGRHSQHNSSYWKQHPYLGVGPSAHSYDGQFLRQFNISNNTRYVQMILAGTIPAEIEALSEQDRLNEYILTSLRTKWGSDLDKIAALSTEGNRFIQSIIPSLIANNWLHIQGSTLYLTGSGKFFADRVAEELFWLS
ncbi:MAG: radical SAM family heme chaperone HemW [Siphonobacter sp.]